MSGRIAKDVSCDSLSTTSRVKLSDVPAFANNTAAQAAGLVSGDLYRVVAAEGAVSTLAVVYVE